MLMKAVEKQGWKAVHEPTVLTAAREPDVPIESVGAHASFQKS
jgi:hypothetical protein